jgi:hypothetical protein
VVRGWRGGVALAVEHVELHSRFRGRPLLRRQKKALSCRFDWA